MNDQHPAASPKREESDSKRLFRKHLTDPNHVITDEELASIRIGATTVLTPVTDQNRPESAENYL